MPRRSRWLLTLLGAALVAGGAVAFAGTSAGPVNVSPPTIQGDVKVGGTVTADPGDWTSQSGATISYAYLWQTCDGQGNGCQPLLDPSGRPYTSQTINGLRAPVGTSLRVVVTATDPSGSAAATSAPAKVLGADASGGGAPGRAPSISLIRPRPGSVIHFQRFPIVLRISDPDSAGIRVQIDNGSRRGVKLSGRPGVFRSTAFAQDPGRVQIAVTADDGTHRTSKAFVVTAEPAMTAVQELGGGETLSAPGCFTCVIDDPRGDNAGAPPDIASVTSTYAHGWITITAVTYDTVSPGHGGHPCIAATTATGPHERGFDAGCFEGPHTGMIFGNSCAHPDANGDCGSAHMSFPNSHTTRYRFRPDQIGNPAAFYWDAWVLYPGDAFKDTAPSKGARPGPGQPGIYCQVKQQLRRQPPSAYGWGRDRCSQAVARGSR